MKIAIIGACGMVGKMMVELLTGCYKVRDAELFLFEHESRVGEEIESNGQKFTLLELTKESLTRLNPDFALFAAGGEVSKEFAPIVAKNGGIAIDNSSYFRMDPNIPLCVPEVNPEALLDDDDELMKSGIIANPNCSTIQAVVALKPLDDEFYLKRVIYSTYQAVSGAGSAGVRDLENGAFDAQNHEHFVHPIYNNLIPHIDMFMDDGYTKEELKMMEETKRILDSPGLKVTATAVRVPVKNCHSVSIVAQFKKSVTEDEAREALVKAQKDDKGLKVLDFPRENKYPMPILADGNDNVYVGRIREANCFRNGISMFVVSDNIRKGAATNAVQIMHYIIGNRAKI